MKLNKIQKLRYEHLKRLGVDFDMLSESLSLTLQQTIELMTELYQYNKLVSMKKIVLAD